MAPVSSPLPCTRLESRFPLLYMLLPPTPTLFLPEPIPLLNQKPPTVPARPPLGAPLFRPLHLHPRRPPRLLTATSPLFTPFAVILTSPVPIFPLLPGPPLIWAASMLPPLTSVQSDSIESVLGLGGLSSPSTFSSPALAPVAAVPTMLPGCLDHQALVNHVLDPAGSVGGPLPISAPNGDATCSVPVCYLAEPPPLSTASPSGKGFNLVAKEPVGGLGPSVCDRLPCQSGSIASFDGSQNHLYPPSQSELHPVPHPCDSADVRRAGSASSLPVVNGAGHSGISWSSVVEKRTIGGHVFMEVDHSRRWQMLLSYTGDPIGSKRSQTKTLGAYEAD